MTILAKTNIASQSEITYLSALIDIIYLNITNETTNKSERIIYHLY